jgi:hypothetical protein
MTLSGYGSFANSGCICGRRLIRGRKPKQEPRAAEFRRRLIQWKQTPESSRLSLRALACELGTSHQLLAFYLKRLEKWQAKEYFHQATEIRTRAHARGRLHPAQIKMARLFARNGYPGAQELLQKCLQVGPKKTKRFAEIVKQTPSQEGEAFIPWARRIHDQCAKYDTKYPTVVTEELLQKCSRSSMKHQKNNLPAISGGAAKSFRTVQGIAEEGWQLR